MDVRPVHLTRADEVKTGHGQTEGMIRQVRTVVIRSTFREVFEGKAGGSISRQRILPAM